MEGIRAAGLESVGLWRESVSEVGLQRAARLTHDAGLRVSSLCRGGFLTASLPAERALDDNRRAIDEATTLQAECLVMVVGGLPTGSRDLRGAPDRVRDALGEPAPYAFGQSPARPGGAASHGLRRPGCALASGPGI